MYDYFLYKIKFQILKKFGKSSKTVFQLKIHKSFSFIANIRNFDRKFLKTNVPTLNKNKSLPQSNINFL